MTVRRGAGTSLEREDWIRAGLEALRSRGVESVRVEALAKKLRISKGSFYWHFRDREDLLEAILRSWESRQSEWEAEEEGHVQNAAENWARLLEVIARPEYGRLDLAIFSWARENEKVRRRVSEVEKRRIANLAGIFREVGFHTREAEEWAGAALLAYVGWVERAGRDATFCDSGPDLATVLSRIILAASALASQEA